MDILFLLVPLALIIALFFVFGFIYMAKTGQYDDLETPAYRMLYDDKKHKYLKKEVNDGKEL